MVLVFARLPTLAPAIATSDRSEQFLNGLTPEGALLPALPAAPAWAGEVGCYPDNRMLSASWR